MDFESLAFSGRVEVVLDAPAAELRLNSHGLDIREVHAGATKVPFQLLPKTEELVVGPLPSGAREVAISYHGNVSKDSLAGFYRSGHGPSGYFLTTHLAPTAARRLLPCIDHPAAKAVFEVDITAGEALEVVFNTDPKEVRASGGRKTWTFVPTPKMSTYLLYIGVGKFDTLESTEKGLRVAVKTPPGGKENAAWGLDNGHKSVQALAAYFGIPYPLPKLDLVSVQDFAAGAMENWGAITFREGYLLTHPSTGTYLRQIIAETVAHEIAHQWFGNLVTMEWWNDIWLNESFATIMAFKMVDRFYPDWDIFGQFLVTQTGRALSGDALENTHPIDVNVQNAEEIFQIFDEISYGKGGSVLRMLEAYLGEEAFRTGVANYLKAHAYGNAKGAHLWSSLAKTSGAPVERIIAPWVERGGHPVVVVRREGDHLALSQKGFRLDGRHTPETWPIPLVARMGGKTTQVLFDTPSTQLPLPPPGVYNLNSQCVGFYRVLYDAESYETFRTHLFELPPRERWALVRDLYSFLMSGDVEAPLYRGFLQALVKETDPMVVVEVAGELLNLQVILGEDHPILQDGARFLRAQADRLGTRKKKGEPESTGVARDSVLCGLAWLDAEFAREIAPLFKDWENTDADVRAAACIAFARTEGAHAFDPMVARVRASTSEAETEHLLGGLVAFRDPALVDRALAWSMGGDVTRGLLAPLGIMASYNPGSRRVLWDWFLGSLDALEKVYTGTAMMTSMVEAVIPRAGLGREREVREVLSKRPIAECERSTRKGLEILAIREKMVARLAPR